MSARPANTSNHELNGTDAKVEFFLSDREGAQELRERGYQLTRHLLSTLSVQFELNRAPHSSAQGEWVTLKGPRENLEKAKDIVLASLMPRCHSELASDCQPPPTDVSMAHAVYTSHYDALPPSSLSSLASYSRNLSPPPTTFQSFSTQQQQRCNEAPYPPAIETRTRVETTPSATTFDTTTEQLRDAIQKLTPEEIKSLLLRNLQPDTSRPSPSHSCEKPLPAGLISRSPDQRERKIDRYVNKLNFPREKVELVLNQLGPDASDNDILERLFKVCKPNNTRPPAVNEVGGADRPLHYFKSGPQVIGEYVAPPTLPPSSGSYVSQSPAVQDPSRLRYIVIDGSNVAMRHGNGQFFSCRGIHLAVDYFRKRGHDKITVFVPEWRKEASKPETPIAEQEILHMLERDGFLKYTPSRRIKGKRVACYDDRFILDLASATGGVIVSNDQFRDLMDDKPDWREMIETRLLQFQFVDDYFMIPFDPMGKDGPTLDQLLCKDPKDVPAKPKPSHGPGATNSRQICPYLEKCTFGRKCKFYHPEREPRPEPSPLQSSTSPVGSRTPNASRSATPSPSPEKWYNRYGGSNRSSGEDLRQLASNNGSTDDLSSNYHHADGSTVDIAELSHVMQSSLRMHDIPPAAGGAPGNPPSATTMGGYHDNRTRPLPPQSMGIHSAPVFATSAATTPSEPLPQQQHRYTFPMAVLPQAHHVNSRTHVITEQHHRQMTAPQGGVGGVASAMGIPQLSPEMDPNVMLPLQRHTMQGGYTGSHHPHSGYHPSSMLQPEAPPPSNNALALQGAPPGVFVPRDGWMGPSSAHYSPQGLVGGRGNSLIPGPPGYYPLSQGPPGFNSRGGNPADSGLPIPHSHSVPSTHTSPYHQYHHQPQDIAGHHSQRHSSLDYGNPQNISPQRRASYSTDCQQMNGTFPQASPSAGGGGYGGGPYYQDHNQPAAGGVMTGSTGFVSRPGLSHQSSASFSHSSSHHPHPSHPHSSHPHRLPAVNERVNDKRASIDPVLFSKLSAVFPGCDDLIATIMTSHPHVVDFEKLVTLIKQTVTSR